MQEQKGYQPDQEPTKGAVRKFLSAWYESTSDDQQLLLVLEEASSIVDMIPANEPIDLERISERLNTSKTLSVRAKELIPFVIDALGKAERNEKPEIPVENRAYKTALFKEVEAYSLELYDTYHNEEHDFDTRRSDVLDLIYEISDEEQDDFAFIERRADTWTELIRPRVIERAKEDKRFVGKEIEQIIDEVLPELHRRALKRL